MRTRVILSHVIACVGALSAAGGRSMLAQAPQTPQDPQCIARRLVGTWERVFLLRNALSVQPSDAPLFVN